MESCCAKDIDAKRKAVRQRNSAFFMVEVLVGCVLKFARTVPRSVDILFELFEC